MSRSNLMKKKSVFSRMKNELLSSLESGQIYRHEARNEFGKLATVYEDLIEEYGSLEEKYETWSEVDKLAKLSVELERIEEDFTEVQDAVKNTRLTDRSQANVSQEKSQEFERLNREISNKEDEITQLIREIETSLSMSSRGDNVNRNENTAPNVERESDQNINQQDGIQVNDSQSEDIPNGNVSKEKQQPSQILKGTQEDQSLLPSKTAQETQPSQKPNGTQEAQPRVVDSKDQEMFSHVFPSSTPICPRPSWNYMHTQRSLEMDSIRRLKPVAIPKFAGDKRNYASWKAAFYACVDQSESPPEYKLLRLRECLQGDALKVIENLGHSSAAYDTAKSRLERKYGGTRRAITLRLEELSEFKPIREGNEKDLESLAELLDVVVVNLKDAGLESELGNGSLYINIMKKMHKNLLAKYNQWISDGNRKESVEMLREFIDREAQFLTTASETITGVGKEPTRRERTLVTYGLPAQTTQEKKKCPVCAQNHGLWSCEEFKQASVDERWRVAKDSKACFRCLSLLHHGKDCQRSRTCGIQGCRQNHHRLLHGDAAHQVQPEQQQPTEQPSEQTSQEGEVNHHTHTATVIESKKQDYTALRTVPLFLINGTRKVMVNALLDDASTRTYVNADVAAELGLEGSQQELTVNVLNDNQETLYTSLVEFRISSLDGKTTCMASAFTTERVTGSMKVVDWSQYKQNWKHLKSIQFPTTGPKPIVDLLIGADHAHLMCAIEEVKGQIGDPIARLTPLGWTCIGPVTQSASAHTNYAFHSQPDELNNLVRRFWDVEEPRSSELITPEDRAAKKIVSESLSFADGHYCVSMPWKRDARLLPSNYDMALKRLQSTEKRLLLSEQLGNDYKEVINNYQQHGYIRKVHVPPDQRKSTQQWYLPHFPVLRPDKATTKTRLVFDASAKCQDTSLNDMVYQGPKLQNDLTTVLLRFRRDPIALMCDIKEMYLQIKLKEEDRPYHRFLWRDLDTEQEPDVYEFDRVVFGVASSPFQAQFVAQHHAQEHQETHPLAADTILNSTYMDDSMDSMPDVKAAIELYQQLSRLWASAGMHARKWLSNSQEVLQAIPAADCVSEVDLDRGELPVTKTLGVTWLPKGDGFKFQVNLPKEKHTSTKREFLKGIATIFDPLGFLMPYTIRARILLQSMWTNGLDWDEPLNDELKTKAQSWFDELSELSKIQVPRCLRLAVDVKELTIHTFVDASLEAYGAVTYARHEYTDGTVSCNLVASKSKVAPLHAVSIPRLELMSAIIGLRQAEKVGPVLKVNPSQWWFWSDSMDVLYWIRGQSRQFKPFVAHRVGEIHKATNPSQWRHVSTKQNPADLLTRGQVVAQLKDEKCWWEGPPFLKLCETEWPVIKLEVKESQDNEVRKQFRPKNESNTTFMVEPTVNRLDPTRYSSWRRLSRVLARVLRFPGNCQLVPNQRQLGPLNKEELIASEQLLIKKAQQQAFSAEVKALKAGQTISGSSKLLPLNPFVDEEGILRCNGRLCFAEYLPWESRFPIILPKDHHVTKLIIKEQHEQIQHGGTNQVLAELSAKYWILSAREAIREWEKECMECRRRKSTPQKPMMAPLPVLRTQMSLRPFCQASVDYAGPFITKQGRGKTRLKRYLCLFTCLSTRAVHLEMSYSLDTDSFLNAFFRMASRRGMPEEMLSDNGTNFVGAKNELDALKALDKDKIQDTTSHYGVKWHFNPPLAPHFSGVHEVMVKAAKKAIVGILGSADITDEELVSAVVGAEGLINSRPLTYQSANPADTVPITPNHFLHGQLGGRFAPESVDTTVFNPRKRWRRVQELVRHFWHRWIKEWLPGLNARKKWFRGRDNLKEGDVVILMSPDTPRGKWPLGRIVKTKPGADGQVRVADVQVGKTIITRPVVKLCPLEYQ